MINGDDDEDDLERDNVPPPADRVARRAMILAAMAWRAGIDMGDKEDRETERNLRIWFDSLDLGDELHPSELEFMHTPFGQIQGAQRIRAEWQAEGLAVIAWALGLVDLIPHDQLVDPDLLSDALLVLDSEAAGLIARAKLRPIDELSSMRELMYAIDVRFNGVRRRIGPVDITSHFLPEWWTSLGLDSPLADGGDFAIDGRPVLEAAENRWRSVWWTVKERHRASIWLIGEDPIYCKTTADT